MNDAENETGRQEGEIVQSTVPNATAPSGEEARGEGNQTPTEQAAKLLQSREPKQGIELDNEDG